TLVRAADGFSLRVPHHVGAAEVVYERMLLDLPQEPLQFLVLLSIVCRLDSRFRHGSAGDSSLPARSAAQHIILAEHREEDPSARVGAQLAREIGVELLALLAVAPPRNSLDPLPNLLLSWQANGRR